MPLRASRSLDWADVWWRADNPGVIVHLNGRLLPLEDARISPFDRGFIFGDGVYEGLRSFGGRMRAMDRHIARMRAGLAESRIQWDPSELTSMSLALIHANAMPDAFVYWQVTRGTPGPGQPVRSRVPAGPMTPTVFGYCSPVPPLEAFLGDPPTIRMATRPDLRWQRGHLKSISLMGGVLSALEAAEHGAADALLVRDGWLAEGTYANTIVGWSRNGREELATPPLNKPSILAGVTRSLELESAPDVTVRPIHQEELAQASEIMLVGTTTMVTSVTHLDGVPVGDGRPGPMARRLLASLVDAICGDLGIPRPSKPSAVAAASR